MQNLWETQKAFLEWLDGLAKLEESGTYTGLVIGMNEVYLDYLQEYSPFTSGSFDEKAFASGEFAVYESLGMTWEQIQKLLLLEGIFHAGLMLVILIPATILFDRFLMPKVVKAAGSWSMVYICSFLPLWLFTAVLGILAVAVTIVLPLFYHERKPDRTDETGGIKL